MLYDTAVIGGGVIGVSTAYYLAKRGQRVALVEQNELGSGCSQGNAGQITPGHLPLPQPGTIGRNLWWLFSRTSPLYIPPRLDLELLGWLWRFMRACNAQHLRRTTELLCRLGSASIELFDQLRNELEFGYEHQGRLEICRTEATFRSVRHEAELLHSLGFESQLLHGAEVHQFEPAVTHQVAGGVYFPRSAHCQPLRFVLQLAAAAEAAGAELRLNTEVTDVRLGNGGPVRLVTQREELEARHVVVACGSWSARFSRRLGLRLPIQPGKGYHLDLDRPARCPKTPVVLVDERIFVTPIDDYLRLAGTMELGGFNLKQHPARIEMLSVGAGKYLSLDETTSVRSKWCHLRPMTADGLPVIGPVPHARNVWLATGHGMLGLTQGPITGKLVAEALVDGRASIDLAPLRPDRF